MEYTKGPWKATGIPYNGIDDPIVTTLDGTYIAQTVYDTLSHTEEHNIDADTLLIAAAPVMYEALKELEWSGEYNYGDHDSSACCPLCEALVGKPHESDCVLGKSLALAEGKEV